MGVQAAGRQSAATHGRSRIHAEAPPPAQTDETGFRLGQRFRGMSGSETVRTVREPQLFLRNLWYFAALDRDLRPGRLRRLMLLGEPVLLGRMRSGEPFALRDICPHRGVPLSAGRVMREDTVECAYHGWRFRADGVCALIPSLVEGQGIDAANIRARPYPLREQDGLIWIYFAADERSNGAPASEPPRVQISGAKPRWVESQTFHCGIDDAVIGLMDPAHAPYVHGRWWWRKTPRVKTKDYAPLPNGFVMQRHPPSKPAYRLLGSDVTTEITFQLPS